MICIRTFRAQLVANAQAVDKNAKVPPISSFSSLR